MVERPSPVIWGGWRWVMPMTWLFKIKKRRSWPARKGWVRMGVWNFLRALRAVSS